MSPGNAMEAAQQWLDDHPNASPFMDEVKSPAEIYDVGYEDGFKAGIAGERDRILKALAEEVAARDSDDRLDHLLWRIRQRTEPTTWTSIRDGKKRRAEMWKQTDAQCGHDADEQDAAESERVAAEAGVDPSTAWDREEMRDILRRESGNGQS